MVLAVAAAFLFFGTAWAQEGTGHSYVDLVMLHEVDPDGTNNQVVGYSVRNIGTATATGVTVSFLLEDLDISTSAGSPDPPDKMIVDSTNQKFTWKFGNLSPGETSLPLSFSTGLHSGHTSAGRVGVINATASSVSPEPDTLLGNNVAKVYSYARDTVSAAYHIEGGKLGLLLSVDNLRPTEGSEVDFELTAQNLNHTALGYFSNNIANVKVKVELSKGLKFKDGWTPPTAFVKSGNQSATWSTPVTDTDGNTASPPASHKIDIEAQLTSDKLSDIPLEERCITAWVDSSLPPPSPDYAMGSLTECLSYDDPPVLFSEGLVGALTPFPCVGVTEYPCLDEDGDGTIDSGIEVAASVPPDQSISTFDSAIKLRSHGVGRIDKTLVGPPYGSAILQPDSVVIQVQDPKARVNDTNSNSVVTNGISWQTGRVPPSNRSGDSDYTVPGVQITYTRKEFNDAIANWDCLIRSVTVGGLDGADAPGRVKIRFPRTGNTFLDPNPTAKRTPLTLTSTSTTVSRYFFEFSTLGTYVVDFTAWAINPDTVTSCTNIESNTNVTSYEDTGTYTFHVGPVAELEVRDGGPNLEVSASQRAYTIMAVNNGPDAAPAAKVTLTGLDAASCRGNATKGSVAFVSGECAWTIGELITKDDFSLTTRERDGEVLTIITSAAADTKITAKIENTDPYQVCIDSSGNDVLPLPASESACETTAGNTWHTAKYYDHISDNNSASIASRAGIQGQPQATLTVTEEADKVTLSWPAQTTLTDGSAVTSYGLVVSGDGGATWRALASRIQGTPHSAPSGALPFGNTRHYAVFAQNRDGDRDLPFATAVVEDVVVRTNTVTRTETVVETVVETETVVRTVPEDAYAYFADEETTRTVAENSAPGSPVGAPVTVVRNSGNEVAYSLEGPDAALFAIEQDSGQILVGEGTLLDYESDTTSYTVEVVADPSSGDSVRTTVTISVVDDVSETGFVFIDPAGVPQMGFPLFASLMHTEGEPIEPRWQWQRSMPDGTWADIPGRYRTSTSPPNWTRAGGCGRWWSSATPGETGRAWRER